MGKRSELRRSCNHCRTRKIACSGEQICARCKTRGFECVYGLEGSKGRPRSNVPSNSPRHRANEYPINWTTPPKELPENEQKKNDGGEESESPQCVAVELDIIYREHFGGEAPRKKDNLFQKRIASFNRALLADKGNQTVGSGSSVSSSSSGQTASADGAMNYHGFLTLVTLDLIETIVLKFSRLGVHAFFGSGERYYQACMLQDNTTAMFDEPILASTAPENINTSSNLTSGTRSPSSSVDLGPLTEYSSHLLAQLIDVWFTHHPMCILLSKSLLLSDLHTNSAKPVLVAVLLADAHEFTKDPDSREQADRLLNWAIRQLQVLKPAAPDLTIAQAIFMIGWRQICWGQVRRAVCCVAYAGRITTQLKHQIHHAPILEQTHINGVDRGAVDAEMIQSLWWQTFCLCVWSFIQMNIEFNDLLPARLMQKLPPANEGESALLKLDRITGNIITKNAQTSSLQSVWLLAHTGSLAAYLYALYPKSGTGTSSSSSISVSWQNEILARLNDLVDRERGLAGICKDAREAIQDMVACVNTNAQDNPAGHWLLVMYHTISIHVLFPRPKPVGLTHHDTREDDNTERKSMTALEGSPTLTNGLEPETLTGLETAVQGLITLFPHVQAACSSDKASRTAPAAFLHSYILGIDAVGRALMQVLLAYNGGSLLHQQILQESIPRFMSCATTLHELFNHDTLLRDHRWRLVKRQLKTACKGLEGISTTASNTVLPNAALSEISSGHHYSSLVNNVGSGLWSGTECETGHAHHPGSSTQDFPDFSLDLTPPMDEYFTAQQYESFNSVTNESLAMHMFQNATPLTSLWNELQVTGMSARSPPNFQSTPLEMQVGMHGKRQVDSLSGDEVGYSLFGDPGFGGLANPLTPNKRVRTSADGTSGNQEVV